MLREARCLELVEERSEGGRPPAKFFRRTASPWFETEDWERLPDGVRQTLTAASVAAMTRDVHAALRAGMFETRHNQHLSRSPLTLDVQGFAELADATDGLLATAHEIEARALQRIARGEAPVASFLNLLLFERGDAAASSND